MVFPGTERLRDRKAGQKGGTKGHFPGTDWQRDRKAGQNVWDRRAGTERLGSSYATTRRVWQPLLLFDSTPDVEGYIPLCTHAGDLASLYIWGVK